MRLRFVAALPLTATMKVKKVELKEKYAWEIAVSATQGSLPTPITGPTAFGSTQM
jgi:hypothetical protein